MQYLTEALEFIAEHNVWLLAFGTASGLTALELYFLKRERREYKEQTYRNAKLKERDYQKDVES